MPSRKSNKKKRAARRKATQMAVPVMPVPKEMLTMCEEMYIRALADPFDPVIQGKVCYPSFPAKKSVKQIGNATVNVAIGTNGLGWLAFDVTPSNANNAIFYTDATYAGDSGSAITTTVGSGVHATTWATPNESGTFTESTTGVGNQFRIVCAGAKFRYTGTELNRGGSVFAITTPQQDSLNGCILGNSADPMLSREHAVDMEYQTVVLPPMHDDDVQWKDGDEIFPWSDGGTTTANPLLALVFVGTPGNTFVVRLMEHIEVAGQNFNGYGSMSHIGNPLLIQSVTTAATSAVYSAPAQGKSYLSQFVSALSDIAEQPIVRSAAKFAGKLAMGALQARYGGGRATRLLLGGPRRVPQLVD